MLGSGIRIRISVGVRIKLILTWIRINRQFRARRVVMLLKVVPLRARRVLMLLKVVPLKTRRAL